MKALISFILLGFGFVALAQTSTMAIAEGGYLLRLKDNVHFEQFNAEFNAFFNSRNEIKEWNSVLSEFDVFSIKTESALRIEALNQFAQSSLSLRFLRPCRKVDMRISPDDTRYGDQWNLQQIEIEKVWNVTTGGVTSNGDTIVVALLEQGIDAHHLDLAPNLWSNDYELSANGIDDDNNGFIDDVHGWNFKKNQADYQLNSHGTWVGGVLAAEGNNKAMISGIGWNTQMMVVQIGDYEPSILQSLNYVLNQRRAYNRSGGKAGAFVVALNASFGLIDPSTGASIPCAEDDLFNQLIDALGQEGVLVVGAVPNEDWDIDFRGDTPSACPSKNVISVTATDRFDVRATNVAFGKSTVDLAAPGVEIPSLGVNSTYFPGFSGASAACPHVTGTIGLLYSLPCERISQLALTDPEEISALMKQAILEGVVKNERLINQLKSGGRLNAFNSMLILEDLCGFDNHSKILKLYPNPVDDDLNLELEIRSFEVIEMEIFDVSGRTVFKRNVYKNVLKNEIINVENWNPGVYFVRLKSNKGVSSSRFVKK